MNPQVVDTNIYTGLSFNVPYQGALGTDAGILLGPNSVDKIFLGDNTNRQNFCRINPSLYSLCRTCCANYNH